MKQMIFGSTAIKHWFEDFKREPKDLDLLVEPFIKSGIREIEHFPLIEHLTFGEYVLPDELYTLKISHTIRPFNYDKHLYDIRFLKEKGCKLNYELLIQLLNYWDNYHGKRRMPNFDMKNEDFFKDKVKRAITHDDLHLLIKYGEVPAYSMIKEDISKAVCSEKMFNASSDELKKHVVLEEVFVIAIERYYETFYKASISRAFKDLITRLFPEWLAVYTLDNYTELSAKAFNDFKEKDFVNFKIK